MINAPPTFDWAGRDPAADLTAALTANNWQQDYDAGITVDAEFSRAAGSFPADPARLGAQGLKERRPEPVSTSEKRR